MILARQRPFDGPVTLTADTAVTFGDIAGIASELTGRDIRRVVIDGDTWVAGQVAHGTPEFLARFLLGTFQAARQRRFAGVDPLLGELLGRSRARSATCSPSAWTRSARAKRFMPNGAWHPSPVAIGTRPVAAAAMTGARRRKVACDRNQVTSDTFGRVVLPGWGRSSPRTGVGERPGDVDLQVGGHGQHSGVEGHVVARAGGQAVARVEALGG